MRVVSQNKNYSFDFDRTVFWTQYNVIYAKITSASKLNKAQLSLLANNLSKYFSNKKVIINEVIDETLIGGVKIVADGKLIDLSLTNRLESLMNQIE